MNPLRPHKTGRIPRVGHKTTVISKAVKKPEVGSKTAIIRGGDKREQTTIIKTIAQPRPRVKPTARRRAEPIPPRRAKPEAPSRLKPQGLSLGLKYTILTTVAIALAVSILVIVAYFSVRREVEDEINKSGIMLVKVLSSFDFEHWENLRDKSEDNPLARISSDLATRMGISIPSILNLVITDPEKQAVLSIRPPQVIKLRAGRTIKVTADKIKIMEYDYMAGLGRTIRTRSFKKLIIGPDGSRKGYVQLFLSAKKIDEVLSNLFVAFLLPALIAILIGVIIGFWMAAQVTRPVQELMSGMQVVSRGDLEHHTPVSSKDEIGVLAEVFNRMTEGLKIAHEQELEAQALEHELDIAHEIQANLLPKKIPQFPGYDIMAYYRASKDVGGDYYDIIQVDEEHLGFVVADVSGKGIPGSMVMTMARSLIRMMAQRNISPADILRQVNRALAGDIRRGMFITALYFILNLKNRTIQVSSAGHNPMVVWRRSSNTYELINPNGIALGFDRGLIFDRTIKEQLIQLYPQDRIVIYTDGVVEAMNSQNEEFGNARFYKLIGQLNSRDSRQFVDLVVKALDVHKGTASQHDDITLVTVRGTG